jgi:hypothetical protein
MNDTVTKLPAAPEKLKIDFKLNNFAIDGAVVRPLTFSALVECIITAQSMTHPKTFEARLKRVRMQRQVSYYTGNVAVPVAPEDVLKLPISAARIIMAHLDDNEGASGKVVREGDGIDQAIVYELGTPIPIGQGKTPIKELEFQASTYGDIEDVLAVDLAIQQTQVLIATVAKPLGTSLQLLPDWAAKQITVADGVTISQLVLPRFLGSPDE